MRFRRFLSHMGVALSLCVLTITYLEARNPSMGFLTSIWSAVYIALQCLICILLALLVGKEAQEGRHRPRLPSDRERDKRG